MSHRGIQNTAGDNDLLDTIKSQMISNNTVYAVFDIAVSNSLFSDSAGTTAAVPGSNVALITTSISDITMTTPFGAPPKLSANGEYLIFEPNNSLFVNTSAFPYDPDPTIATLFIVNENAVTDFQYIFSAGWRESLLSLPKFIYNHPIKAIVITNVSNTESIAAIKDDLTSYYNTTQQLFNDNSNTTSLSENLLGETRSCLRMYRTGMCQI